MRTCRRCETEKAPQDFYTGAAACKVCVRAASRAWRAADPEGAKACSRRSYLLRMYGLTVERHDALAAEGCVICRADTPGGRGGFHVDHDHACCPGRRSCGACVRGLLCNRCNHALGLFQDDPDLLRRAAAYLGVGQ